jgi:hypothetical protein
MVLALLGGDSGNAALLNGVLQYASLEIGVPKFGNTKRSLPVAGA